jgi:ATP-dependent Lon protease
MYTDHNEVDRRVAEQLRDQNETKAVEEKLKLIRDYFGEDDSHRDETVVKFNKQFQADGPEYHYAAIRTQGMWYTTGKNSPKGLTWMEFVLWLVSGPIPTTEINVLLEG